MPAQSTLLVFTPFANEPPSSNYASMNLRNLHPVLDFDDSTNESAIFTGILPKQYSGGGVTVYIHYCMKSAVADVIQWDVSFERIGEEVLDIDSDSFATAQSGNDTVPGTSGHVGVIAVSFTDGAQMDALVAGESFRIKVTRNAATDTAVGDAQLVAVEIRET